jgi:hypothetical protein
LKNDRARMTAPAQQAGKSSEQDLK